MEVKFIQAITINKSNNPLNIEKDYHIKCIKGKYYLIKTYTLDIQYTNKNNDRSCKLTKEYRT
jgi:hypothetical protein